MTNAKKALEKVNKEFGIKTGTTSNKSDKGKQSTSASPKSSTTTKKEASTTNKAKAALEKVNKEFGIKTGTSIVSGKSSPSTSSQKSNTKKYTDFNSETQNAYTSAKDKVTSKTTISSNLTDKERNKRISEINSELNTLKSKLSGYSRASAYGTSKAMTEAKKKDEARIAELSEELKTLERVGTFSASELKQFEIDDAKKKVSSARQKVNSYGQRPSLASAESYKQANSELYKARQELEQIERQKELYEDIADFGYVSNEDTFTGQWRANYRSNELSREADKAMSEYIANPTEENKQIAYAYDAFEKAYKKNNEEALDDENVKASWLSKSAAGYLPQFKDQILPEAIGYVAGGLLGSAVGAPTVGAAIGSGIGTFSQSYSVMQGSVYRTLLAEGVDEEIAKSAAQDEALVSSLIESGETAASVLLSGGISAFKAIGNAAKASVAKGSTNVATKLVADLATKATTKATNRAASKVAAEVARPLWSKGLRLAGGVVGNGLSEYVEEFTQGAVSRANQERALSGDVDGKGQLIKGASGVVADAVAGKDPEALAELHEQGVEGFKIGLMFGGTNATVNNIVSHYANAKTVKIQNEVIDDLLQNEEDLKLLIESGKASGTGTVSERIATEIETAKANGKEVTREQVKQLLEANEVYKNAEEANTPNTLEQAAREVVNEKNRVDGETRKTGRVTPQMLETLSQNNEQITNEEVKKVTGFGVNGVELVTKSVNAEGATFYQTVAEIKPSYNAGFENPNMDIKKAAYAFKSPVHQEAFNAGQKDGMMKALEDKAHKAVVHEDSGFKVDHFKANPLPSDVTQSQVATLDLMAKALGVKSYVTEGLKGNAELDKLTGEVPIDVTFEREVGAEGNKQKVSIVFHAAHEMAVHRVVELEPEAGKAFVYAMYKYVAGDEDSVRTLADEKISAYSEQGVEISLANAKEEVSANNILRLYDNDEAKFHKAIERIVNGTDTKAKQGLRKYIEILNDIIRKIGEFLRGKSAQERAKIQAELDEVRRLRDMFETAFAKAVENKKAIQANQSAETRSEATAEPTARENNATNKETPAKAEKQPQKEIRTKSEKLVDRMKIVLGDGEKSVGIADGQAYVTNSKDILPSRANRSVFLPVNDVEAAKVEFGAKESNKTSANISKILASDSFVPVRKNFVDGTLEGVGGIRVFTDENGREIALETNVAKYFEGYNLEATFRGGKPYAIKATDNNGNVAGVAMAVWMNASGQKYNITDTTTGIKAGDVFVADKGIKYKILSRDAKNTTVEISSEKGSKTMVIANEVADSNFSNIPKEGITKWIDEDMHIDNRTWEDVGSRSVKAFQFLFPEMQEYYRPLAQELLWDLDNTVKGERILTGSYEMGNQEWTGVERITSDAIATIKDSTNATYDDIRNALNRLIKDEGQENIALAKRIELVLDEMLTDGYNTFDGMKIPPNEEYIAKKEELIGKTYEGKKTFDEWNDDLPFFSLKGTEQKNTDLSGGGVKFSLKNANLTIKSKIPFTTLDGYIAVAQDDNVALDSLESAVQGIKRGTYTNDATGYSAKITGDTINKAIRPARINGTEFTEEHIRNLNAMIKLPELFKKAVYVDSKPPQKVKNQKKAIKEYHHFVAPVLIGNDTYRALITAREKINSNTLYVLQVEVLPMKKRHTPSTAQQKAGGSRLLSVPSNISIPELVKDVKIYNYDTGITDIYSGKDIKFSLKDEINSLPAEDKKIVLEARQRAIYSRSIATMSESRLSKAYSDYSYSDPSTTKGYLAYIEPYDFIYLTTTNTEAFLGNNPQRLNEGVSEQWGNENNIQKSGRLYLRINEDGKVVGHEGRHRMAGLLREGVDRVAVVIETGRVDNAKPISIKKFLGQDFGETRSYKSVYVHNMLPISKEYENINRHIFGDVTEGSSFVEPNIRYSLKAKDQEYLELAKDPKKNEARLRELVDEAAKEAGYIGTYYHGSRSDFTIFKKEVGGKSNSNAGIGFWFTESEEGAKKWADNSWWGDNEQSKVYKTYLRLNNPKVYETVDTKAQREELKKGYKNIDKEMTLYDSIYYFEDGRRYHNERYDYDKSKRRSASYTEWEAFKAIVKKYDADHIDYYLEKIPEGERQIVKQDAEKYLELSKERKALENQITELRYYDAYELFRTDMYKQIGMGAEDANIGGTGKYVENKDEMLKKYVDMLKQEGYDGIIIKGTSYDTRFFGDNNNQYLVFDSNQAKSAEPVTYDDNGNIIPLSERFNTKNDDIRYSLKDSEGKTLTEAQAEFFKDSKIRDENGNLLVVYHGSPAKFTVFNHNKINAHGNAHGRGFYFTEKKSKAEGYKNVSVTQEGGQLLKGYLNITNPMSEDKVTIKKADLLKLVKALCKEQAEAYVKDGEYDNVQDAILDSWISNYVYTYGMSLNDAYREVTNIIYSGNTTDVHIISELTNAGAGNENVLRLARDILGYDGVIYTADDGSHEFVSLVSEQFKSVDNANPTTNPDINYSLKGTNNTSSDGARIPSMSERLAKYAEEGVIPTEVYEELIEKYGAIHTGEKPSRDVQVPRKSAKNKKVSQTVRTVLEAQVTPDEAVPTIEKMVEDGIFSYEAYSDKAAIANSEKYLQTHGWAESYKDWFDAVDKGEVSKDTTTMGWVLYNNAANRAATTTGEQRQEAIKESLNILEAMVRHQRSAAQALQATRILKKLSPESQLYAVQKSVSAFQKELTEKYGDKAPDLQIDEELVEKFLTAETEEERLDAEKEIYKDIGRQMPSDWLDKWNAWRYVAMLTNPRTHIRNILGNAFFAPVVATKNLTATAIESMVAPVVRLSGREMLRGKSIVWGNKADRALLKAAWNDYANVADIVSNGGKYNDSAMGNKYIQEGRRIFKGILMPVEWVRRGNSNLLEWEDMWFSKPHYAYALAQYCKANNITAEQIQRGKAIAPAREYAIKEAQKATYKDTNAFSQMVSEIGRNGKRTWATNAKRTLIEGVLPFRKTPANILVRGVEYSPLGFLKGLADLRKVGKKVDGRVFTASEAIDNISAGLTGTGLLALGVYLAAQGLVRGHGEEDKEEKEFKELMGHQNYALELPNGESVTLDWLAPESLPFFTGVAMWEMATGDKKDFTIADVQTALQGISDPMLEMSFLQGLNDALESIGYAKSNDTKAIPTLISTVITSYISQGIPTLFGQIERTGEEERMTTYTEKDGLVNKDTQYALGKASAKIPFWDYNQIPYIDAWGRKEASGSKLKRGLNNFLNPAYTSTIETSSMEEELLRLYEQTGEGGVFPSRADKKFTVDGEDKHLTGEEYVRYATLKGEKSYELVSDLVNSQAYKKLSDEEKVKAIEEAYDYANQKAKNAISNYKPDTWVEKADDFGSNVGNYISFKTEVASTKKANDDKITKQQVADIALDMAQNDSEVWKMYLSMYDGEGDKYAYNKGIYGEDYMYFLEALEDVDTPSKSGKYGTYTQDEARWAVNRLSGLSRQEKAILWQSVNTTWKKNPYR